MSNILIVDQNLELSMLIKLNLLKHTNANIIEKLTVDEGINIVEIINDFELIICNDESSENHVCEKMGNYLSSQSKNIPLLAVSSAHINYARCEILRPGCSWKLLVDKASQQLGGMSNLSLDRSDFVAIPATYFFNLENKHVTTDVYIRLKKDTTYQYIKRIHSGDTFELDVIKKYMNAGLKEFFISREGFAHFVDFVSSEITDKLKNQKLEGEARVQVNSEAFEITQDRIFALGVDATTVALVKESIVSMEKSIGETSALSQFLKSLKSNSSSYSYGHSYLICMLMHKVIDQFDWNSRSVKDKISYLAYFHDISLKNDRLVVINSEQDLNNSDLTPIEKEKVITHAYDSAMIVDKFPEVPMGVVGIIKEHHGERTGHGFSESFSVAIAPMSMMFIVIEHFVDRYMQLKDYDSESEIKAIIEDLKKIFYKSTYGQTVTALEKIMIKV